MKTNNVRPLIVNEAQKSMLILKLLCISIIHYYLMELIKKNTEY